MYLSFYRNVKFETILNYFVLNYARYGHKKLMILYVNLALSKLHDFTLSGSLNNWITKQSIQHLQYWG